MAILEEAISKARQGCRKAHIHPHGHLQHDFKLDISKPALKGCSYAE